MNTNNIKMYIYCDVSVIYLTHWMYVSVIYLTHWMDVSVIYLTYWMYVSVIYLAHWMYVSVIYLAHWMYVSLIYLTHWMYVSVTRQWECDCSDESYLSGDHQHWGGAGRRGNTRGRSSAGGGHSTYRSRYASHAQGPRYIEFFCFHGIMIEITYSYWQRWFIWRLIPFSTVMGGGSQENKF